MKFAHLLALIAAIFIAAFDAPPAFAQQNVKVAAIAESDAPKAGSTTDLVIRFEPRSGWYGYWKNPGEGGVPADFRWKTPKGVSVGQPSWPAPIALSYMGMTSYVMDGSYSLVFPMKIDASIEAGTQIPVAFDATLFLCTKGLCSAQPVKGSIDLVVGDGAPSVIGSQMAKEARASLPLRASSISATSQNGVLKIVSGGSEIPLGAKVFLSDSEAPVGVNVLQRSKDGLSASIKWKDAPSRISGAIVADRRSWSFGPISIKSSSEGGLAQSSQDETVEEETKLASTVGEGLDTGDLSPEGEKLAAVSLEESSLNIPSLSKEFKALPALSAEESSDSFLSVLLAAFVGGLLLNLMPCVFPILSLKALSLARSSADEKLARVEGVGYALGTVTAVTSLGACILVMREFGASAGWSFQLQSPAFVLAMLGLVAVITLNLAGSFEFAQLGRSAGIAKPGFKGAAGTGALAALIASPCAGPFMAGALGAALVLPPAAALAVFAGLGLGMAAPFLLIAFVPAVRSRLPRPGAWMGRLRRILAVPMALTAAWLLWLLWRQAGPEGLAAGSALLIVIAIGMSLVGHKQRKGSASMSGVLATSLCAALVLGSFSLIAAEPVAAIASTKEKGVVFSEAELERMVAEGTPVLLDFTADWCLTCKVNEKVALGEDSVIQALDDAGVVVMTGDWTNGDPAITAFLEKNGRNAIPFYVLYDGKGGAKVLPQILTPSLVIDELEAI